MSGKIINVGFIGNPNCGKTTLFNAYTGANLKVANWPGVTVEKKEGRTFYKGQEFKLIDLPGIYSLTSYTMEEKVSRECIMSDEVSLILDILKEGKTKEEQAQIDKTIRMTSSIFQKHMS